MSRPPSAPRRRCHRRASSTSSWRPIRGANKRGKLAQSCMPQTMSSHLRTTSSALLAAHPRCADGAEVRKGLDQRGVQYGPAFTGLGVVHVGEDTTGTVLAEVALPGQIRSQQGAYGVHPALLDACFQSVGASPQVQALGEDVLALPLGVRRLRSYGSARTAHYCYTRVTKADTSTGSRPTSTCSTSTGQSCSPCRGCDAAPASPGAAATNGCWPSGC